MRYPAIPIATCTPDFSLWSASNKLTDSDLQHWSNAPQPLKGILKTNGKIYGFMGKTGYKPMSQTGCLVDVFSTTYNFSCKELNLTLKFTTPLLLDDLKVLVRPLTYIDIDIVRKNGYSLPVDVEITAYDNVCVLNDGENRSVTSLFDNNGFLFARVGNKKQEYLKYLGDMKPVNYGYFYLSVPKQHGFVKADKISNKWGRYSVTAGFRIDSDSTSADFIMAYDSVYSIEYFKKKLPCAWKKEASTIEELIQTAFSEREEIFARCEEFTAKMKAEALKAGGKKYVDLLVLAYRQTIGAHILAYDADGNILFVSKECGSGAHAATVDVTYPSIPLFLKYNPELVEGMVRPIFRYAKSKEWRELYKFAPHDVGFYPCLNGQTYPEGRGLDLESQMPVEECANMLIISAALCKSGIKSDFIKDEFKILNQWCGYLVDFGYDPGDQLCTDDFAGRLAHNCNLSVKAIMGIASFGIICDYLEKSDDAFQYYKLAREYAEKWVAMASTENGTYKLSFDLPESFSLKYNAVWDKIFNTKIFPKGCFDKELKSYTECHMDKYGTPLDNRKDYAKSDWILWCASMMKTKADFVKMISPLWDFYNECEARVPMTDFYYSLDASVGQFRNRTVQGGLFIKLLSFS